MRGNPSYKPLAVEFKPRASKNVLTVKGRKLFISTGVREFLGKPTSIDITVDQEHKTITLDSSGDDRKLTRSIYGVPTMVSLVSQDFADMPDGHYELQDGTTYGLTSS